MQSIMLGFAESKRYIKHIDPLNDISSRERDKQQHFVHMRTVKSHFKNILNRAERRRRYGRFSNVNDLYTARISEGQHYCCHARRFWQQMALQMGKE